MSNPTAPTPDDSAVTAPSTDKVPLAAKLTYGFGGMNEMFGHWLYPSLVKPVFNMQLGLSPTLIGFALMVTRLCDGAADTVFGWLSDNTRSRWGRRRPYILGGSIAAGVALPCLFLASGRWDASAPWRTNGLFWFMLISCVLFTPIISMYSMPFAGLGSELTPSYHERTSVMAFKAVMQKIAGIFIAASWWMARTFGMNPATGETDILAGARRVAALAGAVMIVAGVACFFLVRERYYEKARRQAQAPFWATCRDTFGSRPFVVLLTMLVLFAFTTSIANDLGQYAGTYYVFGGDLGAMSKYHFYAGLGQFALGMAGVFLATWNARRLGKRKALLVTLAIGLLAYGSSWWMYAPGRVWAYLVNTALTVMATTGLWVLAPSMCVDVVDEAELRSGQRREGAFNSWLSWSIKFCLAFSWLVSGVILEATGFHAALGGNQAPAAIWWIRFLFAAVPVVALSIVILLLGLYPLSQRRVLALRVELEARRGQV
jgi:GPH family glycoside/pentoside/hexuronide:cation symporter